MRFSSHFLLWLIQFVCQPTKELWPVGKWLHDTIVRVKSQDDLFAVCQPQLLYININRYTNNVFHITMGQVEMIISTPLHHHSWQWVQFYYYYHLADDGYRSSCWLSGNLLLLFQLIICFHFYRMQPPLQVSCIQLRYRKCSTTTLWLPPYLKQMLINLLCREYSPPIGKDKWMRKICICYCISKLRLNRTKAQVCTMIVPPTDATLPTIN